MKGVDKTLIGIVAGVVLLVVVALVVALLRPSPTYLPNETPEGVAHNYLLALEKEEYERAYSYLSPTLQSYPASVSDFTVDVLENSWIFNQGDNGSASVEVESARVSGDEAVVSVQKHSFYQGDPLSSSRYDSTFTMQLQREAGAWKIVGANDYWLACWDEEDGCP